MAINLDAMSAKELRKLKSDAEQALKKAETRDRREARKAAEKAAGEFGFSLDELTDSAKPAGKAARKPSKAKYRNPANPDQTWTGRGRKPQWVHDALAGGADISDLEI